MNAIGLILIVVGVILLGIFALAVHHNDNTCYIDGLIPLGLGILAIILGIIAIVLGL